MMVCGFEEIDGQLVLRGLWGKWHCTRDRLGNIGVPSFLVRNNHASYFSGPYDS